jgi:plastocyanin
MALAFPTGGERETTHLGRTAVAACAAAVLLGTLVLMGWMLARVAEHPGVPRETGALPSWFTGAPALTGAHRHEADAAAGSAKPGASAAPAAAGAAEGDYTDFANGEIEIALKEYEFTPSRIRTRPGAVVFVLRNAGRFAHDFHVEGPGFEVYAEKFSPGRTVRVQAVMQEGEYKVSCPLSNHDERGMNGKLIVTSKLAGS